MEAFLKDLRQSFRILRVNPAFTLAAIAALTLGIGANTAIFSIVNAVMLRPVAVPDADRLVIFQNTSPEGPSSQASPAKFLHYRAQADVVTDVAAFRTGVVNYSAGSAPEQLRMGQVSADFFTLFGAETSVGRTFNAQEDRPGGEKVVVLGQRLWIERFSRDPNIIGRTILLSNDPYVVVGVLADFSFRDFGPQPDVWMPFQIDPNSTDQGHYFQTAGRLKPGVTLQQARAKLATSATFFGQRFPNTLEPNQSFSASPIRDVLVQNVRSSLLVLTGAVTFVLLIACANVANLLLARAAGRSREIAIRAAIGGSRGRIIRQLLTESVVLSSVGGVLGLGFGLVGMRALLTINTAGLPRIGEAGANVGVDWRVAVFAIGLSLVTGIVFGLIPALQGSRTDLSTSLKESAGRSGTGTRQNWTRALLVITEVALAVILLVGSSLLIRTAVKLANVKPGFDVSNVLTMRMSLTGPQFATAMGVDQLVRNGAERLKTVPGVELASATCCVPLEGGYGLPFRIMGRPLDDGPFHGGGGWTTVAPGYFEVFKIPVVRGRTFTERDLAGSQPVVVINEAMARQFWPKADPLADRLLIGKGVMREFADEQERQVIGIVGDTHAGGLDSEPQPEMFIPQAQVPDAANALNVSLSPLAWVVRTRVDPGTVSNAIQEQLRQVTGLPVANARTMMDVVERSTSRSRFNMWLMTVFGASALLLAAIGIYGLMAYSVAQRTQEIGIRLALGAQASDVRTMIVLHGMKLSLIGVVVGLAASFALAKYIASFLFEVQKWDPLVFTAVPLTLLAVAWIAAWLPAVRASHVDPLAALRDS